MAHSLSSILSTPRFSVHPRNPRLALSGPFVVGISRSSSSIHGQRAVAVQAAMESPAPPASDGTSAAAPSKEDAKKGPLDLLFRYAPSWASWILGAAVLLAFPFYRRILKIEDKVEKAVEIVGDVAAEAEKISQDLAESLPENSKLKQVALKAEMIAEEVAEDAEKVEAFLKEADEVVEKIETVVKHVIEAGEEGIQDGNGSNKQSADSKNII